MHHIPNSFIIMVLWHVSQACFDKILECLGCSLFIQLCTLVTQSSLHHLFTGGIPNRQGGYGRDENFRRCIVGPKISD